MDKEHLKGEAKKAEGHIKDAAGKLTGDRNLQAEGKLAKVEGEIRKKASDVKGAVREAADRHT